jgi:hypothetical protein
MPSEAHVYPRNLTKQKLRSRECAFGMSPAAMRSAALPRIFAALGYDFLTDAARTGVKQLRRAAAAAHEEALRVSTQS